MHDQREPTSSKAMPPPLPPRRDVRIEPRIELHIAPAPASDPIGKTGRFLSRRRLALCYGFGGFVAGVVFWHAVGFWQLIHSTIYSTTPVEVSERRSQGSFADTIDRAISSSSPIGEPAIIATGTVTPQSDKSPTRFDGSGAGDILVGSTNCASFTRDPTTGEVRSRPCSETERDLPHKSTTGRENLQPQKHAVTDRRWPSYMPSGNAH